MLADQAQKKVNPALVSQRRQWLRRDPICARIPTGQHLIFALPMGGGGSRSRNSRCAGRDAKSLEKTSQLMNEQRQRCHIESLGRTLTLGYRDSRLRRRRPTETVQGVLYRATLRRRPVVLDPTHPIDQASTKMRLYNPSEGYEWGSFPLRGGEQPSWSLGHPGGPQRVLRPRWVFVDRASDVRHWKSLRLWPVDQHRWCGQPGCDCSIGRQTIRSTAT